VLRSYVIPCGAIGSGPLTPDEDDALTQLVDAISSRVTLVLSRSELRALSAAIDRLPSRRKRERLQERLAIECTNAGAGLHVIDGPRKLAARSMLVKNYLKMGRVDAVIGGIGVEGELQRAPEATRNRLSFIDAAREIAAMPLDRGLGKVSQEAELKTLFRPLFRFGDEVVIIDPYLAVEVLRSLHGEPLNDAGMAFIVATAAQSGIASTGRLRITLVCCRKQLERELRKLQRRGGSADPKNSVVPKLGATLKHLEEILRQRLCGYASGRGLAPERISVATKWISETSDRGFVSSSRVWNVEHSLQSLTALLNRIRKGKPLPRNKVRLRLLHGDGAEEIRRLVCEARPAC
jgi:hypothetical protein